MFFGIPAIETYLKFQTVITEDIVEYKDMGNIWTIKSKSWNINSVPGITFVNMVKSTGSSGLNHGWKMNVSYDGFDPEDGLLENICLLSKENNTYK